MRALFISHEVDVAPGYLHEAATLHGFTVEVCDLWKGADLPGHDEHDLIVSLGATAAAYDDAVPWLGPELELLREAAAAGTPVFGVCFGAQALARALGGQVHRSSRPELGWHRIETYAPDVIAPGPWLEWHFDTLVPPSDAQVLARTDVGVQAWTRGRVLGVQFHPEVTPEIIDAWTRAAADEVVSAGVDIALLRSETRRRADDARRAAIHLFGRVLDTLDVGGPH